MRIDRLIFVLAFMAAGAGGWASTLHVAYAGSMGTVMDQAIGPAFGKAHGVTFQGIGRGAYGLAHLLAGREMRADVFVSVTPGPMEILITNGLARKAEPVASTEMVIAYSPKSRFLKRFRSAARGETPWYEVLGTRGLRFGRTDPAVDPQGRNIIFTFLLAQRYYGRPGLAAELLGAWRNPEEIFTESSLLTRLESGQVDASSGYLSAVKSRGLPYIRLPAQINLADPAFERDWYGTVHFELEEAGGRKTELKPSPLVFYAGTLANATAPKMAEAFVEFLKGKSGQRLFRSNGYDGPKGGPLSEN